MIQTQRAKKDQVSFEMVQGAGSPAGSPEARSHSEDRLQSKLPEINPLRGLPFCAETLAV